MIKRPGPRGNVRRRSGAWLPAIFTTTFVLAIAACSSTNPSAAPKSPGSAGGASGPLIVDLAGGIGTIDPAQACGGVDVSFTGQFYAPLTHDGAMPGPGRTPPVDPAQHQPWFASSWDVSPNGKTYTFHLHPGAKFANGDPMGAAAVKYSLNRSIVNGGCGGYFIEDGLYSPNLVQSISTPNSTTVVIKLHQ